MRRRIDVRHATRREILRKQMELLAEESLKPNKLSENCREIVRINKELNEPFRILFLAIMLTNSFVCILVLVKKLFWC